jgi:hypothetical protein
MPGPGWGAGVGEVSGRGWKKNDITLSWQINHSATNMNFSLLEKKKKCWLIIFVQGHSKVEGLRISTYNFPRVSEKQVSSTSLCLGVSWIFHHSKVDLQRDVTSRTLYWTGARYDQYLISRVFFTSGAYVILVILYVSFGKCAVLTDARISCNVVRT